MKVFISWAGEESRKVASALAGYLRQVATSADVFFSAENISAGGNWVSLIHQKLAEADVGLLILTPENIASPWVMFEAGALSAKLGNQKVVPILVGIKPSDIPSPLNQFQSIVLDHNALPKLLHLLKEPHPAGEGQKDDKLASQFSDTIQNIVSDTESKKSILKEVKEYLSAFDQTWKDVTSD